MHGGKLFQSRPLAISKLPCIGAETYAFVGGDFFQVFGRGYGAMYAAAISNVGGLRLVSAYIIYGVIP